VAGSIKIEKFHLIGSPTRGEHGDEPTGSIKIDQLYSIPDIRMHDTSKQKVTYFTHQPQNLVPACIMTTIT
jgi:hypothetical protein